MPTPFYLHSAADNSGITLNNGVDFLGTSTQKQLRLVRGSGVTSEADATIAGLGVHSVGFDASQSTANGLVFVSNPLNAVTLGGQLQFNLRSAESSTMANYGIGFWVAKVSSGGTITTMVSTVNAPLSIELGTAEAAVTRSTGGATWSSTGISANDRLLVMPIFVAAGGASASGFTATMWYNGTTAGASGDSFVTFAETITEVAGATTEDPFPYLGGGYYG